MKIAYFDCFSGASGDMILGALLDAGVALENLQEDLGTLGLNNFTLQAKRVVKQGFSATKVEVEVFNDLPERTYGEIKALVQASQLPEDIKAQVLLVVRRLAEVEAQIHGSSLEEVHLHELGGVDTLVDITGTLLGLRALGVERMYASPLPLGRGWVRGAHGQIPLPAPAVVALLKDVPVVSSDIEAELVTPTAAVVLTSLAVSFGPIPSMKLTAVGYGAGERDLPIPNVLRILLGQVPSEKDVTTEMVVMLETNIDDLNPEIYDYLMARLFQIGALDVFLTPIHMKKNRPGILLSLLCLPQDVDALSGVLFKETSTLGLRKRWVEKQSLARSIESVETSYGTVRVKVASWGESQSKFAPEYEDCRSLAEETGVPLQEIYRAAIKATEETLESR